MSDRTHRYGDLFRVTASDSALDFVSLRIHCHNFSQGCTISTKICRYVSGLQGLNPKRYAPFDHVVKVISRK
uniref:Uncharacterized protein n=1 Tax=uncultured alpha proteobacterium EB000_37G09 TaxID=710792 RepID=E0XZH7_9PROT|nr:hypothetical protein [uncultured alpha proteobacterium EB000_37G09]